MPARDLHKALDRRLDDHLLETSGLVEEGGGEGFVCEVSHGVPLSL